MNYSKHVEVIFLALLSGSAGIAVSYLGKLSASISAMSESVSALNAKMEVLTTKLIYSEQTMHDHEIRLRRIEIKAP